MVRFSRNLRVEPKLLEDVMRAMMALDPKLPELDVRKLYDESYLPKA